ncbi:MAG: hypothetical protein ACW98Y_00135 [Candidatus Thorarchaeota archaeon]|jgi:hypothetical protein
MLRTSSDAFPAEKKLMSDVPYVLRVGFGDLAKDVTKIIGKPIGCQKCGGFLMSVEQVEENEKVGKFFNCAFCGTLNIIGGELILAGDDTDFVIEPAPEITETGTDTISVGGKSFLALIDVSGSMAGANLSAVKRSLTTSIDSLAANAPDTQFGLVEFESSVLCRDLESGEAIQLPYEVFPSYEQIVDATKKMLDKIKLVGVGKNSDKLKQHVSSLRDQGGTALGPAVAMASVIAKHRNVGRVVLLTDGLANEGIGALEGYQVTPANAFYEGLGKEFMELGTAVDVVGIASGSGMELKTLGLLAEATGGTMFFVKPNELDKSMSELAGASLLGRDVEVKLVTPTGIKVKDASGVSRAVIDELTKKKESKIGVVGEDHELYFEIEPESKIKEEEVPIQVQVSYTDEKGARRVRAVTAKLKVVDKKEEVMETLDPTLGATFVTQKAGEESFAGGKAGRARGKKRIAAFRSAMKEVAKSAPKPAQAKYDMADKALEAEENEMEELDEMMEAAPVGAPSSAADEAYTKGLAQMRKSSKQMYDDEDEE